MLNVKKDFIGVTELKLFRGNEKEKNTSTEINDILKVLLQDIIHMREQQEEYTKESHARYQKINKQLDEINSSLTYSMSEQEKLKIKTATTEELARLTLDNQLDMRNNLDKLTEGFNKFRGDSND